MNKSMLSISGIGVILALIFILNTVSGLSLRNLRWDLTEEQVYTLASGTRNILANLPEPITIKYFYSSRVGEKIPAIQIYHKRVHELLMEFAHHSGGMIKMEVYDPEPDSEEEEIAQKLGLQKIPVQAETNLFFGMIISSELGEEANVPFFDPRRERFLEYDIAQAIVRVSNPEPMVIGVLSALPVMGSPAPPQNFMMPQQPQADQEAWALISNLQELYTVKKVETDIRMIPSDISLLLVIHPKDISPQAQLAIDQYLLEGRNAIVLLDPNCENDTPPPNPMNPYAAFTAKKSSNLPELLAAWGLKMNDKQLVGDLNLATTVRSGRAETIDYPIWLSMNNENCNQEEVITDKIDNLLFITSGSLEQTDSTGLTYVPLIHTSDEAAHVANEPMLMPQKVIDGFVPGHDKFTLAYMVSGKFSTAFPDGVMTKATGDKDAKPTKLLPKLTTATKASTVVVFADVDFASDRYSVQKVEFFGRKMVSLINDNLVLLLNTIETMGGSPDLINIRSRGKFERPFTRIKEMQMAATERWKAKEQALKDRVEEIGIRIQEMEEERSSSDKSRSFLSSEQIGELGKIREQRSQMQKELRSVRKNLRQDVESMQGRLQFYSQWLMPLVVMAVATIVHFVKNNRGKS